MNSLKLFLSLTFFAFAFALSLESRADFGEMDILVRESVEAHFKSNGLSVDMQKLSYIGDPNLIGDILVIHTSAWAEQLLVEPSWRWYKCTTELVIVERGRYSDNGSNCLEIPLKN